MSNYFIFTDGTSLKFEIDKEIVNISIEDQFYKTKLSLEKFKKEIKELDKYLDKLEEWRKKNEVR
jgi:hypothetical protein